MSIDVSDSMPLAFRCDWIGCNVLLPKEFIRVGVYEFRNQSPGRKPIEMLRCPWFRELCEKHAMEAANLIRDRTVHPQCRQQ